MSKEDRDVEKQYSDADTVENCAVWLIASNPARTSKSPSRANAFMFPPAPSSPSNMNVKAMQKNWNSSSNGRRHKTWLMQ